MIPGVSGPPTDCCSDARLVDEPATADVVVAEEEGAKLGFLFS